MRRLFITLAFFSAGLYVSGQSRTASVFYQYDSYGNCILHSMNVVKKSMKNMQTADTLKVQVVPDVYIGDHCMKVVIISELLTNLKHNM